MEKHQITAYIYIILAVFLWATIEIVMKLIQNNSSPYLMNFFRFLIGGITLLIYAVSSHKMRTIWGFFKAFPQYYIPAAVIGLTGGLLLYSYVCCDYKFKSYFYFCVYDLASRRKKIT
ncbi:MAG: EamA family transporter [Promethearchaeota archaeon]